MLPVVQMVSSTQVGKVLDTYTFTKPAGWQPAGVKAMRALAANQNVIYQPNTTLETSGTGRDTPPGP